MRVLVTGATGFVGQALVRRLSEDGSWQVRASGRRRPVAPDLPAEWMVGPELGPEADWRPLLEDVAVVVHLAARVHVRASWGQVSVEEFVRPNAQGTARLAAQAAAAGVRRLVFVSTVKVHGERGQVTEESATAPVGPYAESKNQGEQALRDVAWRTGLEAVIIRPPLVYGPGVRANFRALLSAVERGIPLPLGGIANRRSLVSVDNLVDLIVTCLDHPAAASEAFLVSDGEDLSTPDLVRRLAAAVGRQPRLVPVPAWCLRIGGSALGLNGAVGRLTGSLHVDISKARTVLGWVPPVSVDEGLRRVARHT